MRIAVIQGGEGLETVEEQAARLRFLAPDAYHIEPRPTSQAAQRLLERLEALGDGDELCLTGLEILRAGAGETALLLAKLVSRGVRVTIGSHNGRITLGDSPRDAAIVELLAELQRRAEQAARPGAGRSGGTRDLLSDEEIADIHRLHRAGMTPRRIGLIYHRSPNCILDILCGRAPANPDAANSNGHAFHADVR